MRIPFSVRLETRRSRLAPVSMEEVRAVYETLRFPGFTDGLLLEPPANHNAVREGVRADLTGWAEDERYVFTVWWKEPRMFAGRIGIRRFGTPGTWNLGFWISPGFWGKGLAGEVAEAIIRFGFTRLGSERIWMAHAKWNDQSRRVMGKLPVRFLENDSFEKNGKRIENVRYQITAEEWRNLAGETGSPNVCDL